MWSNCYNILEIQRRTSKILGCYTTYLNYLCAMPDNDIISLQDAIYLVIWGRFPADHQPGLVKMDRDITWINWWHWQDKKQVGVCHFGWCVAFQRANIYKRNKKKLNARLQLQWHLWLHDGTHNTSKSFHWNIPPWRLQEGNSKTSPPCKCFVFSQ